MTLKLKLIHILGLRISLHMSDPDYILLYHKSKLSWYPKMEMNDKNVRYKLYSITYPIDFSVLTTTVFGWWYHTSSQSILFIINQF